MNLTFKEQLCSCETRQRFLKILIFAMRTGIFYMAFVTFSMQFLLANHEGKGQGLDSTFIAIETKNESLKAILKTIERQTDLRFTFNEAGVKNHPGITLPKAKWSVKELLDFVMHEKSPLTYVQVRNSYIIIKEKEVTTQPVEKEQNSDEGRSSVSAFTVTGTVKDEVTQQPMAGVNIIVKGTTNGTTTDTQGKFSIEANDNDILVFSFIGFKTYETQVSGRAIIEVTLEEDIKPLQEVQINAGYWHVNKSENTGSISQISSGEIAKQPVLNPLQALQGRMPGVYIQQTTGIPGGGFNIQIRGQNSLRNAFTDNGNLPLYIVNGVPFPSQQLLSPLGGSIINGGNPLNGLNLSDIESIEILKDADATAIYGSRGANGVVLINTKKGRIGKGTVQINSYTGFGEVSNTMSLLGKKEYLLMRNEALSNDNAMPRSTDFDLNGTWDQSRDTDWQQKLIGGTSSIYNTQASVQGGNKNIQFLIGAGYHNETTVFPGDFDYQKYSTNFNINHNSTNNKFNVNFSGSYLIENSNLLNVDPTATALTLAPVAPPIFNNEGKLNWENGTWNNPFASFERPYDSRISTLTGNLVTNYQILDGLRIKANLGYNEIQLTESSKFPISSLSPYSSLKTGSLDLANGDVNSWIAEPQIEYQKSLGSGMVTILLGATFQERNSQSRRFVASGFTSDALLDNIHSAPNLSVGNYNKTLYRYNALFGRINYNWKEKYFINLTGRRDGSSRFGPGRQFGNFGAVGAAWIFSKENIMEGNSFISFGKLRGSYGTTGTDQIGDYGYYELWNATSFLYGGNSGIFPNNLFNPDFGWEVNKKLEAGLELAFLEDRIFISTSYYINKSSYQLVGLTLPFTTGFGSIQANFPAKVKNTGFEIELKSINVNTKHFTWSTGLNITLPQNELVSFPDIKNSGYRTLYDVGKSLGIQFAFHYTGVKSETGVYTFDDVNKDENISFSDDRQFLKEVVQKFYGGLQNSFSYKGFQLDVFFQFVKQTGWNYLSYSSFGSPPGSFSNQPTFVLDRWQQIGDITDIQKFTQGYDNAYLGYVFNSNSDNAISDASFIRLKNVSLSYQLLSSVVQKIKLEQLKVYIQSQNLFTGTNYLGLDPENQSGLSLPPLRTITIGIQAKF